MCVCVCVYVYVYVCMSVKIITIITFLLCFFFWRGGCFCYLCFILFCLFVSAFFFTFIYVKCADNVYCLTPHFTVLYDKETILIY